MPSRFFTLGRKFSTTTSAFLTMRLKAASPSGAFRLSVMLRLLRCRFWKSDPSRGPPIGSSGVGDASILMTLAPQSASWRTQLGPARTRVRSRTVKRVSALEARGEAIAGRTPMRSWGVRTSPIRSWLSTGPRCSRAGRCLGAAPIYMAEAAIFRALHRTIMADMPEPALTIARIGPDMIDFRRTAMALGIALLATTAVAQEHPSRAAGERNHPGQERQEQAGPGVLSLLPGDAVTEQSIDVPACILDYTATA